MGVIQGNTRSLDYNSYLSINTGFHFLVHLILHHRASYGGYQELRQFSNSVTAGKAGSRGTGLVNKSAGKDGRGGGRDLAMRAVRKSQVPGLVPPESGGRGW